MKSLLAAAGAAVVLLCAQAQAVTFDILFEQGLQEGSAPIGTGSISFDDPGGTGTFDFFTLNNLSFTASFAGSGGGGSFTLADLATTSGTQVILSGTIGARELLFSGTGDGPFDGSLGFVADGASTLSFSPTGAEGQFLLARPEQEFTFGTYRAVEVNAQVPLPAPALLLLTGLAGLGFAARRG